MDEISTSALSIQSGLSTSAPEALKQKAGFLSSCFNLLNGLVGVGTLSYAYAFYSLGLVTGVIVGVLIEAKKSGGYRSYEECVEDRIGHFWRRVCEFSILFYTFGNLATFLIATGQFLRPIVVSVVASQGEYFWNSEKWLSAFVGVLIILPLLLLREIRLLGPTSAIGSMCEWLLTGFVVISCLADRSPRLRVTDTEFWIQTRSYESSQYPLAFMGNSIIIFGYCTHQVLFPVAFELGDGTSRKMLWVIITAVGIFTAIFLLNGICGFLLFGDEMADNVLNNYEMENIPANFARVGMAVTCLFAFPVILYSGRLSLLSLVCGPETARRRSHPAVFLLVQMGFFLLTLLVAILVPQISVVLGLAGAVGGSVMMFLLPGLLAASLAYDGRRTGLALWKRVGLIVETVVFLLLFLFCLVTGLIGAVFQCIDAFK